MFDLPRFATNQYSRGVQQHEGRPYVKPCNGGPNDHDRVTLLVFSYLHGQSFCNEERTEWMGPMISVTAAGEDELRL